MRAGEWYQVFVFLRYSNQIVLPGFRKAGYCLYHNGRYVSRVHLFAAQVFPLGFRVLNR